MNLKQKIKDRKLSVGTWLSLASLEAAEVLAGAGFEWFVIDQEHTATDLKESKIIISAMKAKSKDVFVRVGANDELAIKRAMDSGASGVIVPMVKSRAEAERAISFVKYPPAGKRGVGLYAANNYGYNFKEYCDWVSTESVVIAQVEHIEAVKNLEEIISTPGLDAILIGPYDLSASMGFPGEYDREDVRAALKRVEDICAQHKFPLGAHVVEPLASAMNEKIKAGYTFLAFGIDFLFMGHMAREQMAKLNNQEA